MFLFPVDDILVVFPKVSVPDSASGSMSFMADRSSFAPQVVGELLFGFYRA